MRINKGFVVMLSLAVIMVMGCQHRKPAEQDLLGLNPNKGAHIRKSYL